MVDVEPVFVRASALSGYADCPRRAAARLFKHEILAAGYELRETGRSIGASIGTAVHAGAALTLREKMAGGATPLSAATDCAVEEYRAIAEEGMLFDRETPTGNAAESQIVRMVDVFQRAVVPHIEPIAVEERLECDTGFGIILTGQKDVLARDPNKLHDVKTGKRQSKHTAQLGSYSLLSKSHGYDVKSACTDFIQRVSLSKPQPEPVTTEYNLAKAENVALNTLRHIASDLEMFRNGDEKLGILPGDSSAFMTNPSSMLCSDKFCPAWGSSWCREWSVGND